VGRTYGEGIESGWSHMNPVSMSTKEMAPSARREVIDDHWGSWNHQKTIGFGAHFLLIKLPTLIRWIIGERFAKDLHVSFAMAKKHQGAFEEFSQTFPIDTIKKWQAAVDKWDTDHSSKPDPYEEISTGMFMDKYIYA
jgi:hypothetical protein